MRKIALLLVATLILAGCTTNTIVPRTPTPEYLTTPATTQRKQTITPAEASLPSGLFYYFFAIATREKPFEWPKLRDEMEADGFSVVYFEDYIFVADIENEGVWLGILLTVDDKLAGGAGSEYNEEIRYISEIGCYANYEHEGGRVELRASGDKYYLAYQNRNDEEVDSIVDIYEYILTLDSSSLR